MNFGDFSRLLFAFRRISWLVEPLRWNPIGAKFEGTRMANDANKTVFGHYLAERAI